MGDETSAIGKRGRIEQSEPWTSRVVSHRSKEASTSFTMRAHEEPGDAGWCVVLADVDAVDADQLADLAQLVERPRGGSGGFNRNGWPNWPECTISG